MNILKLQLRAFGPFTDSTLDMENGRGLCVTFGPNEAGKSSALRALRALLYGIPHNSPDNFLHEHNRLRIGGVLRHSDGSELVFLRRKGKKDTILGPEGKPIDDTILDKFLYGVGEELFSRFFGINHETLVRGGEDILKGEGEVGQSLFAAGLGGIGIRQVLQDLDKEADSLFRQRGQNQLINKAINDYGEAKRAISEASLSSQKWSELDEALNKDILKRDNLTLEVQRLRSQANRLDRLQQALPKIAKREELLTSQREIGQVVQLSPEFTDNRRDTIQKLQSAQDTICENAHDIEELDKKIAELEVPGPLLDQAESIGELYQRLGSQRTAANDLGELQGSLQQLKVDVRAILCELRPDLVLEQVEELRLSAAERIHIQNLGVQHQTLVNNLQRASQDLMETAIELECAMRELENMYYPRDPAELRRIASRIRKYGDIESAKDKAIAELKTEEEQAQIDLNKLGLWHGTIEELENLPVPALETVDRFQNEFQEMARCQTTAEDRISQTEGELRELEQEIEELRLAGTVPSEEELAKAREKRDQGWRLVRREWIKNEEIADEKLAYDADNALAEAYEKNVGYADELADRLRREADRVAYNATLATHRAKLLEHLYTAENSRTHTLNQMEQLQQEWIGVWQPADIVPLSTKEMRSWLGNERNLSQRAERIRQHKRKLQQLIDSIEQCRTDLNRCLESLNEHPVSDFETLEDLLERCQLLVEAIEDSNRRRKELQQKTSALELNQKRLGQAEGECIAQMEQWQADWTAVIANLGLNDKASPAEANSILVKLEELFKKLDDASKLEYRLQRIEKEAREFTTDTRALVQRLAPHLADMPADQAAAQLQADLGKAKEQAATQSEQKKQIQKRQATIRDAESITRTMTKRLEELCQQAGCSNPEDLEAVEKRSSQFQSLQNHIDTLHEELRDLAGGATVEQLLIEADEVDSDLLPILISDKSHQLDELESKRSQLDQSIGSTQTLLQQMDGNAKAAEAAEKSQAILATIRTHVDHYVRLRMASSILRKEIERYRAENQDQLLKRASELFSHLTLGSFPKLETDFNEKDEPVLFGVRSTGQQVAVSGMSDGTRDQLYLSLRLASLEKYLTTNEPMPFIVDDILIRFDDQRSEATLKVLAELSAKTQVIFFTHHSRLVELAKQVVPNGELQVCTLGK